MTSGENFLSAKLPIGTGFAALAILLIGFGSWGVLANIAGAIIANGRVEVEQNRQVIQHPDGGIVAAVHIREGDLVSKNQALLTLDTKQLQSQLNVVEAELFATLATIGRLLAERDQREFIFLDPSLVEVEDTHENVQSLIAAQQSLLDIHLRTKRQTAQQLNMRKSKLERLLGGLSAQRVAMEERLKILETRRLEAIRADRSFASAREIADLQKQLGALAVQKAANETRIIDTDLELLRLTADVKTAATQQLPALQSRAFRLREERQTLSDQLKRMEIRAPVSGHVFGL